MVYMWTPMRFWLPFLTYGFILYFAVEFVAWLGNASLKLKSVAVVETPHAKIALIWSRVLFWATFA
jgi:hypothetical protein